MCFFLQSFQEVNQDFTYLFQNDIGDTTDGSILQRDFEKYYGWMYNIKCVSELEGCKMDEVYEMPTRQFLNDLSYLKMKRKVDKQQEDSMLNKKK